MSKRPVINFTLDSFAFVLFIAMLGTGIILRYKLPAGSGGFHSTGYSFLSLQKNIVLLWGMTRHQWGFLHYWVSIGFLAILSLHIILHWNWIVMMVKGKSSPHSGKRLLMGIISLAGLIGMLVVPAMTQTTTVKRSERATSKEKAMIQHLHKISGQMTLLELQQYTGIQLSVFKKKFKIPVKTLNQENLGHLRKTYGFSLQEVRLFIKKFKEQKKNNVIPQK